MTANLIRAGNAATKLLLAQRLYSLRIDVTRLAYDRKIIFDSMQHFCAVTQTTISRLADGSDCLKDGCTFIRRLAGENFYVVLYNGAAANTARRGFTLAHEVGHIYLAHQEDGDLQEREANHFAAQLLAPEILVHALVQRVRGPVTPEDLCQTFAVSRQAAENRIRSLARFPHPRFSREDLQLLKKTEHLLPDAGKPLVDI